MNCMNCFTSVGQGKIKCQTCNGALHAECAINDGGTFCDVCYTVKQSEGDKVDFTIPDTIRRTYIETYRSCPHKFFKEVIEGIESPPTCYTQIGIDLHEIFEKACNQPEYGLSDAMAEWSTYWDGYSDDLFADDDQREKMLLRGNESVEAFFEVVRPSLPPTPFITEQKIEFSIGENIPKVNFTMDRIDQVDGMLEMHDWKTGKVMVGKKLSSDLQAPLYIYGTQLHYGIPVRSFSFYYLQENKTRVFTRVDNDNFVCTVGKREYKINLTDAIREIKSIFSQIKKGNFNIPNDTRNMYFTCKMCHIKEMGICEGAEVQAWKNKW